MKKKYIAIAGIICFAVFIGVFALGKKDKDEKEGVSNNKTETSVTVDDTVDGVTGQEDVTEDSASNDIDDIETWIEPAGDNTSKQDTITDSDVTDNNEKNTSAEDESESSEDDDNKEEKPEWIGGDF